jgi:hypothetical protein
MVPTWICPGLPKAMYQSFSTVAGTKRTGGGGPSGSTSVGMSWPM